MKKSNTPLRILHLILKVGETNSQYNEHCLPVMNERSITICSYFKSELVPPKEIPLFDGDNSLGGFFRALRSALQRDYDVIHAHSPYTGVFLLMALAAQRRYKALIRSTVYTVHDSYQDYKLAHRLLLVPIFICFRRLIFCGYSAAASFPFLFKWLVRNKKEVVQNAVDIDRVDRIVCGKKREHEPHFTTVSVGRLTEVKNQACLLTAFARSNGRSSRLVFIGEGHLRPKLTARIQGMGLQQQVMLRGLVSRNEVFELLTRADVFVSASRGEGLPVSVLEAMACRCPVILSDIPPHREIAGDADFINLIGPDDVTGFAEEIRRFREMSRAERVEIGEKCRKLVEDRFSLATMHKANDTIYNQVRDLR